jgi:hypothetical protein
MDEVLSEKVVFHAKNSLAKSQYYMTLWEVELLGTFGDTLLLFNIKLVKYKIS